jgi:hypothetical protein
MPEQESKFKVTIQILGTIATFAAILIGVWQFNKQQENNIHQEQENKKYNDAMEFKRKSWENQQEIYLNIAETVGTIASDYSTQKDRETAIRRFKTLYYGKAAFVEDSTVASVMRGFSQDIQDYKEQYLTANELKNKELNLINICKISSFNSWRSLSQP